VLKTTRWGRIEPQSNSTRFNSLPAGGDEVPGMKRGRMENAHVCMVEYLFCFVKGFGSPLTFPPIFLFYKWGSQGRRRRTLARMENMPNVIEAQMVWG
jgi:hypothetical protein